jgi:hypothetical protein
MDDISLVARRVNAEMALAMGEALAGEIETDVSSPVRFATLPVENHASVDICSLVHAVYRHFRAADLWASKRWARTCRPK